MIKNIIFIAAYLLLIPAILAQDSSPFDNEPTPNPLPDQNSNPTVSNQTGDNTMTQATTKPQVTIYTASYCPYCVKAKDLLTSKGIDFTVIDVTDPATRTDMIAKAGGSRTIPQIFVRDEHEERHIGGYNDLDKALNDPRDMKYTSFNKLLNPHTSINNFRQIMSNSAKCKP